MYPIQHTASSKSTGFDEHRWVTQVRRTLEEELDDEDEVPVSIFNVPKALMATSPDSYIPQEVAIGPYHYRRPDLYEMERYKLSAAKRLRHKCKFDDIVKQLTHHEVRIRASYHQYLPLSGETLAWMMAIDGAFLLEFLIVYAVKQGKQVELTRLSSRMSHLLDYTGQKSAHNAVMRDLVMLENQIPLFVLRGLLEFQFPTLDEADDVLHSMLLGFCQVMSPIKMIAGASVSDSAHLLDFLYRLVTPKIEVAHHEVSINTMEITEGELGQEDGVIKKEASLSSFWKIILYVWKTIKKLYDLNGPIANLFKKILLVFKPLVGLILKFPMKILSSIPGLKLLKGPLEMIFFPRNKEEIKPDENAEAAKPPLIEEIAIPSVTELVKSGVVFRPTNGDISTIAFDPNTATFHFPTMSLDVNTGTILRNLVAYEASNASGPLVLTRFTELVNGIVDTEDDVRLLRESGIVLNRLKSDEEVANICNGMSKSIRLTRVPFLDKVIEDVNKFHDERWKVKMGKFMKLYVFGSWKLLTLLAAITMLLLMGLQSLCSVYTCSRFFNDVQDPTLIID